MHIEFRWLEEWRALKNKEKGKYGSSVTRSDVHLSIGGEREFLSGIFLLVKNVKKKKNDFVRLMNCTIDFFSISMIFVFSILPSCLSLLHVEREHRSARDDPFFFCFIYRKNTRMKKISSLISIANNTLSI